MSETWTLQVDAYRGGTVEEVDLKAECEDGRTGTVTAYRFPGGQWLAPKWLELPGRSLPIPSKMARLALRMTREAMSW